MERAHHLFTIGHSSADWQTFLAALQQFEITLLIDVRSRPRSPRFPRFSQPELEQSLCNAGAIEKEGGVGDRLLAPHHFGDVASQPLFTAGRAAALEDAYVAQADLCACRADPAAIKYW